MEERAVVELHAIIRGHVQGVFFRDTTKRFANELGLTGTVRNVPDGNVEIYAQGSKENLENLLEKLIQKGPGHVDGIEKEFFSPMRDYDGFQVAF